MPGPAIAAVDLALAPAVWRALGFTADADGVSRIGATTVRLVDPPAVSGPQDAAAHLPAWTLRGPAAATADTVDGLPTRWTDNPPGPPMEHPNTAVAVDHVVVRTPDTGRTFAALEATGMTLRHQRTAGEGARALRQGFFRHGEAIVEVVGPLVAAGKGAASLWGLTILARDLDHAVGLLGERAGTVRAAVQPGRRIVTVRAEASGGLPLAFMDA